MTEDEMELAERCHTDSCDHIAGPLMRDALRILDAVLDWYGLSKGRVVPELEFANRWEQVNRAAIDAVLATGPQAQP